MTAGAGGTRVSPAASLLVLSLILPQTAIAQMDTHVHLPSDRFLSLEHVLRVIEAWRRDDNQQRPHSALGA